MCRYIGILHHLQAPASHLSSAVVDQLHRPAALVLDPHKDAPVRVTGGQLLEGLIPAHQNHLQPPKTQEQGEIRTSIVCYLV